ncbi:MAG: GGDEF domain-containing protein [Acetivibrio sp.]
MDFSIYPSEIQELIYTINDNRTHDFKNALRGCKKLVAYAKEKKDIYLCSYAYYYMADTQFSLNNYKLFMQNLVKGLSYQQKANLPDLLARSYNLLAICADSHGNAISALDNYFCALKFCEESNLIYESGLVYTNIGHLYISLKDYRTATKYLRMGLNYFNRCSGDFFSRANTGLAQIALGSCYYYLGNVERAYKYAQTFKKNNKRDSPEEKYCRISFDVLYVKLLTASGFIEEQDSLIDEILEEILGTSSILDIYYDVFDFCDHLIFLKKHQELFKTITRLASIPSYSDISNLQLRVLKLKLCYYRAMDDQRNYLYTCERYFSLSQQLEKDELALTLTTLNLRFSLQEIHSRQLAMEQENRILQDRSEHDSLTGLPNRYCLNEYSDLAFDRAYLHPYSLAVEIFDIDCFKQYNDTYGHQKGDQCLCLIAGLLKEIICEDIFCARYGGDEFLIIYENKTDEEVLKIAEKLKEDVLALKIEHKNSTVFPYLTISQGIRNSIPAEGNKLWDFLFAADAALYQVKRASKNDICIVHKTVSQGNTSSTITFTNN